MPEVTPPAVIRLPSFTTRDFTWDLANQILTA